MNFNTHKQQISDLIEVALTKTKVDLIERFKIILGRCRSLFNSEKYDFWLQQLGTISVKEIPITKHGLNEVLRSISFLYAQDRHSFNGTVLHICEQLFTYSKADDLCQFKTQYHYYFYLPDRKVFKESEMGDSDLAHREPISLCDIRIAKISELKIDKLELI